MSWVQFPSLAPIFYLDYKALTLKKPLYIITAINAILSHSKSKFINNFTTVDFEAKYIFA